GTVLPEYEVQYSTDLQHWVPVGGKVRAIQGLSGPTLNIRLEPQTGPIFYRAVADAGTTTSNETGSGGAEVFGYGPIFSDKLARLALLSVQDFATNIPAMNYLPQLTWDPTSAQFWTNFNSTNILADNLGLGGVLHYNYLL